MSSLVNNENLNKKVTLISNDLKKITILQKIAKSSVLINTILNDDDDDDDDYNENNIPQIELANVSNDILLKVVEFITYHHENGPMKEIEKPLKSQNLEEVVSNWDTNFVSLEYEKLFELILAANYLDIKSLLDLTCAKVATIIKGKSPEDIRKTFNIVNDFTPEEEAQVREENKWASHK
jgi:S-phase kinase-associated protein 1